MRSICVSLETAKALKAAGRSKPTAFVLDANGPYEPDVVWFFKHWLGRKVDEAEYTKQEK